MDPPSLIAYKSKTDLVDLPSLIAYKSNYQFLKLKNCCN